MRHLLRLSAVACALTLGVNVLSAEDRKPGDDKPFSDETFVSNAIACGLHQIELGNLAKANAQRDDVKKFGERMVAEHEKCNKELTELAKATGIPVPSQTTEEYRKHIQDLSKLRGAEFDTAYIKHMIEDHEKGVKWVERASKEAKSPELKAFAAKNLPTVREHLEQAKKLQTAGN